MYLSDDSRVTIALRPVVKEESAIVASMDKVDPNMRRKTVRSVVRTLVDMLGVNVVMTDVQPLMGEETGSVLFVDRTEAHILSTSSDRPPSDPDAVLVISLISTIPFTVSWSTHQERVVKERVKSPVESGGHASHVSCHCATYGDNEVRVVDHPFCPPPPKLRCKGASEPCSCVCSPLRPFRGWSLPPDRLARRDMRDHRCQRKFCQEGPSHDYQKSGEDGGL